MSEKSAKACVFLCVALIAFVCSCCVFSMTGGVSDWLVNILHGDNDTSDNFNNSSDGYDFNFFDSGDKNSHVNSDSSKNSNYSKYNSNDWSDKSKSNSTKKNSSDNVNPNKHDNKVNTSNSLNF